MKNIFKKLLTPLVVLAIMIVTPICGDKLNPTTQNVAGGGINNQLVEDSKVTATGDTVTSGNFIFTELSDGTYSVKASSTSISGAIEIPASYNGKAVTQIPSGGGTTSGAFYNCTAITSVTIPDSVTLIGTYAFYSCSGLKSVTIGNSVTVIGDRAFQGCSKLTSITIPSSVTSIANWTFRDCSSIGEYNSR